MKKVININFQGRVIPIEETAYDILKAYIESLRRYFANEEGREEIINDIESRIGELFAERLKKGASCITDDDVNTVIASMGRPEELEAESAEMAGGAGNARQENSGGQQSTGGSASGSGSFNFAGRGRLYRNEDDKIIAGVASGIANYLGIDPVIMRILFVLLFAPMVWVYILLWIIVPSKSIQSNITKRLYRSADDKVIAGVCGGLAAYFNVSTWAPRLIFALPLILAVISGPFNWWWNDWGFYWAPKIITGSLGSTLIVTYIILWIAVPVAVTSSEKLEMRGERVDVNSIRNTVKEDLESFRSRAQNWGNEVRESAQQLGDRVREFGRSASTQAKTFSTETGALPRNAGSGIGHVIGVLFKAFFLFVAGMVALALFAAFVGILFGGYAFFPLKDFIIDGVWQNVLAWSTLFLFLGIPLLGLITWLVRRIIGVRSRNHYLGYVFGGLWVIGLVSFILLIGFVGRNFKTRQSIPQEISLQPVNANKMVVDIPDDQMHYYGGDWFGIEWDEDWPFFSENPDTLLLSTIRVEVLKSTDNQYHVSTLRVSRANNAPEARELAQRIHFPIIQQDSVLWLPRAFAISRDDKWRNQQVAVRIEVPVGKRIILDRSLGRYEWFDMRYNGRRGFNIDFDDDWDLYTLRTGVEYVMTPDGPRRVDRLDAEELGRGNYVPNNRREEHEENERDTTGYRYRRDERGPVVDTPQEKTSRSGRETEGEREVFGSSRQEYSVEVSAPISALVRMFQ